MTGIASLPLLSMRDKASARAANVAGQRQIGDAEEVATHVGAHGVQRLGAKILRSIGRGVEIERELRQFLSDHPAVVRAGFCNARGNVRLNSQTLGPAPGR